MEEQLIDLKTDPYEMTHVTRDPAYQKELKKLRKSFEEEWFKGF